MLTANVTSRDNMTSLNKVPQVIPMTLPTAAIHPSSHFFIAPTGNYALQMPSNSSETLQGVGITPWSTTSAIRSTAIPSYNSPDVFFNGQCLLPVATASSQESKASVAPLTGTDNPLLLSTAADQLKQQNQCDENSYVKIKKESDEKTCTRRNSDTVTDDKQSYPINALIDIPGGLTRGSRTSSLSSSLSTVKFGGSLSQLWAASLSSLSGKLSNMKSTGNIHAEASLPSLGNQYFAFGGSLPELSLTSLSRLLPNSTSSSSITSTISAPSSTGLFTLLQPPLYVYPSQPHLATPFINANGSITFGSFLSTGSSLCSTQKPGSPLQDNNKPPPPTSTDIHLTTTKTLSNSSSDLNRTETNSSAQQITTPGNLNTLAYVASVQKSINTEQYASITMAIQPEQSPIPPSMGLSPSESGIEGMECRVLSPTCGTIKTEDEDTKTMGSYTEVKPYFTVMSPNSSTLCKKEGKEKPYKCDYPGCGRSFSFPAHLKSHVQQIHISYRPCKCDFPGCGKRFYTPQHLNVHRRIHTGERPFVCPYTECSKAFTTAGNLKNHIRTHTGERPYACKFQGCSKRFAEMSSLKKHELTHTGEKPYKCKVCGKAFSQAGSRNTHERKHSRTESDSKISRRYRIKRVSVKTQDT